MLERLVRGDNIKVLGEGDGCSGGCAEVGVGLPA